MLAVKYLPSQSWRNWAAASSDRQLAIPWWISGPHAPEIPAHVLSTVQRCSILPPRAYSPSREGEYNTHQAEKAVWQQHTSFPHLERKWSNTNPENVLGRKGRKTKREDAEESGRKLRQRDFKGGGERQLKTSSSSPSALARSTQWGCRSHSTAHSFGSSCPHQLFWLPRAVLITEPEPERCNLVPQAPKAKVLPTVQSSDPSRILVRNCSCRGIYSHLMASEGKSFWETTCFSSLFQQQNGFKKQQLS